MASTLNKCCKRCCHLVNDAVTTHFIKRKTWINRFIFYPYWFSLKWGGLQIQMKRKYFFHFLLFNNWSNGVSCGWKGEYLNCINQNSIDNSLLLGRYNGFLFTVPQLSNGLCLLVSSPKLRVSVAHFCHYSL